MIAPPPEVDQRALADPNGIECPLLTRQDERNWFGRSGVRGHPLDDNAKLHVWAFNLYYDRVYADVRSPLKRFVLALTASSRPLKVILSAKQARELLKAEKTAQSQRRRSRREKEGQELDLDWGTA